ncbi:hypothetical protein ABID16_000046 [Rhizobium aquaticum]|uniref:Uncharacterized protein n=1 Tax=Rhizobium aquaticum TaxID=1549636 RepID=A0ABV2IUE4_9HYPH
MLHHLKIRKDRRWKFKAAQHNIDAGIIKANPTQTGRQGNDPPLRIAGEKSHHAIPVRRCHFECLTLLSADFRLIDAVSHRLELSRHILIESGGFLRIGAAEA